MIELQGKYTSAKVFTDNIDQETISQIIELCNQPFVENTKIRIMSDCHAGKGCVIGFTADLGNKVIPNIVGVDIGCGILVVDLGEQDINLEQLDEHINREVSSGFNIHDNIKVKFEKLQDLYCYRELKEIKHIKRSVGTLGGGNHFIEIAIDSKNHKYLVIHSGSRNLGKQVADYYQNIAVELCSGKDKFYEEQENIIKTYKKQGRKNEIQNAVIELKKKYSNLHPKYPDDLCFLTGKWRDKYLHDMDICQEYANINRETIANIILCGNFNKYYSFHTIHNYINFKDNIIRKGAIEANNGQKVIIPMNMRDGSLLCIGKGNPDWNNSAPHGAGRIMSRRRAKELITLDEFTDSMQGIYTSSVCQSTIDEAPMVYKPIQEIIDNIKDTVEILDVIKPIYNFKAK
jgi:RNA-splicing ligase RtcB